MRMRDELEMASAIQGMLVPSGPFDGEHIQLASRLEACTEIGGDWVSISHSPDLSMTTAIVADVSGHGAPAALVTAILHGFFAGLGDEMWAADFATWQTNVGTVLTRLNDAITRSTNGQLNATLSMLCFEHGTRKARCVSAGHPSPLLITPGIDKATVTSFAMGPSALLGSQPAPTFAWREVQLHSGQAFLLFTDGVIEAQDRAQRQFGARRLSQALAKVNGAPTAQIVEAVLSDIRAFAGGTPLADDLTLVAGRVR
jgi:phosphoserine phosphatase RsbU/P